MDKQTLFQPDQKNGLIFHILAIAILVSLAAAGALRASRSELGAEFLLYLLPVLAALVLLPILAYRAFLLVKGHYSLSPEGLGIFWGLRSEEIPLEQIVWVRPAAEVGTRLALPWLRWPGGLTGVRTTPGLGQVEFMATSAHSLLVVASPTRLYAISPRNPQAFLNAFQRCVENSAIDSLAPSSMYPSFLLARVWSDPLARALLLTGLMASLLLLVGVILAIPGRAVVSLGFEPDGGTRDPVPGVRLLLLPVLNTLVLTADLLLGFYLYRWQHNRPIAYLVWSSSVLTALLFLSALVFILLSR